MYTVDRFMRILFQSGKTLILGCPVILTVELTVQTVWTRNVRIWQLLAMLHSAIMIWEHIMEFMLILFRLWRWKRWLLTTYIDLLSKLSSHCHNEWCATSMLHHQETKYILLDVGLIDMLQISILFFLNIYETKNKRSWIRSGGFAIRKTFTGWPWATHCLSVQFTSPDVSVMWIS